VRPLILRFLVVLLGLALLVGCGRHNSDDVVAEVNDAALTRSDLESLVDNFDQLDSLQKTQLVESWIQETLLAQEAKKTLLDQDPTFLEQVATYHRRLLADKIMQKYLRQSAEISDQEVRNYYTKHKRSFVRDEDEVFALQVLLPTRDEARELRKVLRDNDLDKKAEFLRKYQNETGLIKLSDLIPEIRNRLARSRTTGIIGPLKSDFGYHVMNVTQWYDKNSVRPLEEVWDEIAGRLAIDKQKSIRQTKIDSLRRHANVNFHPAVLNSKQD